MLCSCAVLHITCISLEVFESWKQIMKKTAKNVEWFSELLQFTVLGLVYHSTLSWLTLCWIFYFPILIDTNKVYMCLGLSLALFCLAILSLTNCAMLPCLRICFWYLSYCCFFFFWCSVLSSFYTQLSTFSFVTLILISLL